MALSVSISGRVELDMRPAEGLAAAGLRKATRIGLSRAASPVKAAVVAHADAVRRYGFLAKSIRVKLKSYPADRWVTVIGPSSTFTRNKGKYSRGPHKGEPRKFRPSKYASLLERGTKHAAAKPWLKPAWSDSTPQFLATVGDLVGKEIEKELAARATR
jgi:hypothetical protein